MKSNDEKNLSASSYIHLLMNAHWAGIRTLLYMDVQFDLLKMQTSSGHKLKRRERLQLYWVRKVLQLPNERKQS